MPRMLFKRVVGSPSFPLIIFLHGFMGSHLDFLPIAKSLSHQFFSLLIDLPGHGQSKSIFFDSFESFLNLIHEVLKPFKTRPIHWVGYSLGGRLIPFLAPNYSTQSACWISSKLIALNENEKESRRQFEKKILRLFNKESFGNFLTKWYDLPLFKTLKNNPKLYLSIFNRRLNECPLLMEKVFKLTSPLNLNQMNKDKLLYGYPKLYCAGDQDAKYSKEASCLIKDAKDFKVHIFEKTSHSVHLEKPELFEKRLLQFLEEHL